MMENIDITPGSTPSSSMPTTPTAKGGQTNNVPLDEPAGEITGALADATISDPASSSLLPADSSPAPADFRDPGESAPPEESDANPAAEATSEVGAEDAAATQAQTLSEKLLALKVVKMGVNTYDTVAETFGAPKLEVVYNETMDVVGTLRSDGMVAATKAGVTKSYTHTSKAVAHTYDMTKTGALKAQKSTYEGTTAAFEAVATRSVDFSKPYVERVLENPQVSKIVGSVKDASVGAGTMVTTMQTQAQASVDLLTGNTAEAKQAAADEEEAWRQVLAGPEPGQPGNKNGEEVNIPARQVHTTTFFVGAGGLLTWRFRVAAHDVGFALRLRVQGDGGSSEVDVFGLQRYGAGVTVHGEWSPSTDANLVVVWDNSYSYLREKRVAFCSRVKKAGEPGTASGPPLPPPQVEVPLPTPPAESEDNDNSKSNEEKNDSASEPPAAAAMPASRESVMARLEAAKAAKAAKPAAVDTTNETPSTAETAVPTAAPEVSEETAAVEPASEGTATEPAVVEDTAELMELPDDDA